ncbi:uncharacterized protein LOC135197467 [Macrobrachium nipponense]|uniref:uncharacterized protein LOC135197467 n=1 Tax=Macrobrachium nipponense TaxID=159736 RepID=UPI0030C7CA08
MPGWLLRIVLRLVSFALSPSSAPPPHPSAAWVWRPSVRTVAPPLGVHPASAERRGCSSVGRSQSQLNGQRRLHRVTASGLRRARGHSPPTSSRKTPPMLTTKMISTATRRYTKPLGKVTVRRRRRWFAPKPTFTLRIRVGSPPYTSPARTDIIRLVGSCSSLDVGPISRIT